MLLILMCLGYGSFRRPSTKKCVSRLTHSAHKKIQPHPYTCKRKDSFRCAQILKMFLAFCYQNIAQSVFVKHRPVSCTYMLSGASSFQGKAKKLKWLFYACQIIFRSFKVLRRGRSLTKKEALPWGWLNPTLWLQTESFERKTESTAFHFVRMDY